MFEIKLIIYIKMDLALNNLQRLICNKIQPINQPTNHQQILHTFSRLSSSTYLFGHKNWMKRETTKIITITMKSLVVLLSHQIFSDSRHSRHAWLRYRRSINDLRNFKWTSRLFLRINVKFSIYWKWELI